MTVEQLNENEINELKANLFWQENYDLPFLYPEDIPNKIIFDFYNGIGFVKGDFFCNINQ